MDHPNDVTDNGRREFVKTATVLAGAGLITAVPGLGLPHKLTRGKATYTAKQVIDAFLSETPNAPYPRTVDQLRSGTLDQEVTGVVTTMFPTIDVINKTIKAGANFIVAHETPFYNNEDATDWLKDDDVYHYKLDLLNKNKIAIWRFHDQWHGHKPDGIAMGNLLKFGWEKYYDPASPRQITLPSPMPLGSIVSLVKKKLEIPQVRLVGDLKQPISTVYLAFGYMDSKAQIAAIEKSKPDLILSGETREWETVERVRDGLAMGNKTTLMVLSHSVSEEAGMEYAASLFQPKLPGIKITHIASGTPFQYV